MRMSTPHVSWPILPVVLLLSCPSKPANAQSTIRVCGVDLRIGMAKDRVIEAASSRCEVKRFRGEGDYWCARPIEKMNSGLAAYDGCHTMDFTSGLLTSVTREVAEAHDNTSADVVNQVYVFVEHAKSNGDTVVVSLGHEREYEKWRFRTVVFSVRDRSMELTTTQPVGSSGAISSIRLTESLEPLVAPARRQ